MNCPIIGWKSSILAGNSTEEILVGSGGCMMDPVGTALCRPQWLTRAGPRWTA